MPATYPPPTSAQTTMRAARLRRPGQPLEIEALSRPRPAGREVLVEVKACGLCGTDLHLAVAGDLPTARLPITLGHEAAGVVVEVGPEVRAVEPGRRVALFPTAVCGRCPACQTGRHALCEAADVFGMARDGALAEYVLAPEGALIPLPEGLPFDLAAVITDGVATPLHALRARGGLQAGESVGIFGCGGLGTHAVQLARLLGAALVVAVDPDPRARDRALALGADRALDPTSADLPRELRALTARRGLDLALECVGRAQVVETALRCLAPRGRLVIIGVGPERPSLPPLATFVGKEQAVLGSFGMDRRDIEDLFALVSVGRLNLETSISARYPLEQADAALQRLASKEGGVVRVVVEP